MAYFVDFISSLDFLNTALCESRSNRMSYTTACCFVQPDSLPGSGVVIRQQKGWLYTLFCRAAHCGEQKVVLALHKDLAMGHLLTIVS
jgi:hypothetical protein